MNKIFIVFLIVKIFMLFCFKAFAEELKQGEIVGIG
jgi:hypothetical protein